MTGQKECLISHLREIVRAGKFFPYQDLDTRYSVLDGKLQDYLRGGSSDDGLAHTVTVTVDANTGNDISVWGRLDVGFTGYVILFQGNPININSADDHSLAKVDKLIWQRFQPLVEAFKARVERDSDFAIMVSSREATYEQGHAYVLEELLKLAVD